MFGRQKLKDEIVRLNNRIADLEERLCPCEEHDWKQIDYEIVSFTNGIDTDILYKDKCKRCGKIRTRL